MHPSQEELTGSIQNNNDGSIQTSKTPALDKSRVELPFERTHAERERGLKLVVTLI